VSHQVCHGEEAHSPVFRQLAKPNLSPDCFALLP
jgi:hypothetical protein